MKAILKSYLWYRIIDSFPRVISLRTGSNPVDTNRIGYWVVYLFHNLDLKPYHNFYLWHRIIDSYPKIVSIRTGSNPADINRIGYLSCLSVPQFEILPENKISIIQSITMSVRLSVSPYVCQSVCLGSFSTSIKNVSKDGFRLYFLLKKPSLNASGDAFSVKLVRSSKLTFVQGMCFVKKN